MNLAARSVKIFHLNHRRPVRRRAVRAALPPSGLQPACQPGHRHAARSSTAALHLICMCLTVTDNKCADIPHRRTDFHSAIDLSVPAAALRIVLKLKQTHKQCPLHTESWVWALLPIRNTCFIMSGPNKLPVLSFSCINSFMFKQCNSANKTRWHCINHTAGKCAALQQHRG